MDVQATDINQQQDIIIDEFSEFTSWTDRYEYLIDLGKSLPPLDEKYKTSAYLVKGCQSQVWLHGEVSNDRLYLEADSDAVITKGIIALLIRVFNRSKDNGYPTGRFVLYRPRLGCSRTYPLPAPTDFKV